MGEVPGERFPARELMKLLTPLFGINRRSKQLLARKTQPFQPSGINGRQLLLEFPAQSLGQSRALSLCRDRNLQCAATNHCGIVEVAALGIVHDIAQDMALLRLAIDGVVDFGRRGGCDY